jgi:hypothetical protein
MMNRIWSIDGKETSGDNGAVVKWDNEKFFHIELGENIFFGEVLEEATESNRLKLKINHRVFEVRAR